MPQEVRASDGVEFEDLSARLRDIFDNRGGQAEALRSLIGDARLEDIAEILGQFPMPERLDIFRNLESADDRAVVLEECDPVVTTGFIDALGTRELIELITGMAPDDAADVVLELPESIQLKVLQEIEKADPEQAEDIRELIEYEPDSAGGIMTTEFVSVDHGATAGSALAAIQGVADVAETIATIFVTRDEALVGVLSIRDLLRHKPHEPVTDFMETDIIRARVDDDRAEAAQLLARYNLQVLPVVDHGNILRGIVTVDDVIDAIQEEFDEDIFLMAGTATPEYLRESVFTKGKKRLPWLLITLVLGMVPAAILRVFEGLIDLNPKLAFFLPVLAGMAGNASIQASTLVVRSLSAGGLEDSIGRMVYNEFRVGLMMGAVCAVLAFLSASLVAGSADFGLVVLVAMLAGMTAATTVGTFVPLVCDRFGIDPAISAGPFITALNDIMALSIYLGTARLLLS